MITSKFSWKKDFLLLLGIVFMLNLHSTFSHNAENDMRSLQDGMTETNTTNITTSSPIISSSAPSTAPTLIPTSSPSFSLSSTPSDLPSATPTLSPVETHHSGLPKDVAQALTATFFIILFIGIGMLSFANRGRIITFATKWWDKLIVYLRDKNILSESDESYDTIPPLNEVVFDYSDRTQIQEALLQ